MAQYSSLGVYSPRRQHGDRIRVEFPVRDIYLGMWPATQVNSAMAIPSWVGARAMMPCGWGIKAGMVRVWVAGKTVWSPCYTRAISEHFRYRELIYKALYKFAFFTLLFLLFTLASILFAPDSDLRQRGSGPNLEFGSAVPQMTSKS